VSEYTLVDGAPPVDDYVRVRVLAGLTPRRADQTTAALVGSWAMVHVAHSTTRALVGMGRVIGDGGWYFHVVDMAVLPDHQRDRILRKLLRQIRSNAVRT